ncbi:MAG: CapA family protein [Alphaproteobacteria bacterium]|nr:CapA family protein [Alphaproteobacteria bacterium]
MRYDSEQGNVTITLTGDAMITRGMRAFQEPQFLGLLELFRGSDITVSNLEMLFHHFEMSWHYKGAASFQVCDPRYLADLRWMGMDVVTTATNHAFDYGEEGFLTTLRHCEEAGLLQAGGGRHLDQSRAPAYLDTRGGRVAVMATTSTFSEESRSGPGRADFPGKPGVSTLRHDIVHHVPADFLDSLREAKRELGYDAREQSMRRQRGLAADSKSADVHFLGGRFEAANEFAVKTACNNEDLESIAKWMRGAKKQADWLVFAMHCHESGASEEWHGQTSTQPPDFQMEFAHFTIDNGADAFVSHGTHYLRGIEIYQGKPIFYSLGNFIFQNETVEWVPQAAYDGFGLGAEDTPGDWGWGRSKGGKHGHAANPVFYRSAVSECRFENNELKEVWLHPVDLGFGRPIGQRGRPVLAEGEVAEEVLSWLQRVSEPFGTEIKVKGNKGVIRL